MTQEILILSIFVFFTIASLYSCVGHAGASGYLAVMALLPFATESIKPTSLVLNVVVSLIAATRFIMAGYFDLRIFLCFIVTSLPAAFLGGKIVMEPKWFKLFAGIFLILSSVIILIQQFRNKNNQTAIEKKMPLWFGLSGGLIIGFISGLIGVGGGIFLTPLLLLFNWTSVKNASGISALFILLNSISGLFGASSSLQKVDSNIYYWVAAVIAGGILGSWLGSKKLNRKGIVVFLFIVLFSAGIKFIFFT